MRVKIKIKNKLEGNSKLLIIGLNVKKISLTKGEKNQKNENQFEKNNTL
jgi:hypothetical protein